MNFLLALLYSNYIQRMQFFLKNTSVLIFKIFEFVFIKKTKKKRKKIYCYKVAASHTQKNFHIQLRLHSHLYLLKKMFQNNFKRVQYYYVYFYTNRFLNREKKTIMVNF